MQIATGARSQHFCTTCRLLSSGKALTIMRRLPTASWPARGVMDPSSSVLLMCFTSAFALSNLQQAHTAHSAAARWLRDGNSYDLQAIGPACIARYSVQPACAASTMSGMPSASSKQPTMVVVGCPSGAMRVNPVRDGLQAHHACKSTPASGPSHQATSSVSAGSCTAEALNVT